MGTSVASGGPGSGVSFDPPWLDDIDLPSSESSPEEQQQHIEQELSNNIAETLIPPKVSPPARFRGARTYLGEYVKSGNKDSLRRSLGHYSKTGMGGAKNVAKRMRVSTSVGSGLFRTLQSVRDGSNQTLSDLFAKLKADGAGTDQFIDVIINSVCPSGGSLDEESCQRSVHYALSDFLDKNPDADVSNLSDDNLWLLTASFLGHEAFSRIQLDIGKSFENQGISLSTRMSRLKDMREYIESEISAQINRVRNTAKNQLSKSLREIMKTAIENTFLIFEVVI